MLLSNSDIGVPLRGFVERECPQQQQQQKKMSYKTKPY